MTAIDRGHMIGCSQLLQCTWVLVEQDCKVGNSSFEDLYKHHGKNIGRC